MWQPETYEAFARQRERPFLDLLSRLSHPQARLVVDAGCGTGRTTRRLADAFPGAEVVGVDASRHMIDAARGATGGGGKRGARTDAGKPKPQLPGADVPSAAMGAVPGRPRYEHADLRTWSPPPADIVVSNAVLHWIPDPEAMVRRLAGWLSPGGVLALQVPANFQAPSHILVREAAALPHVRDRLDAVRPGDHVLELEQYARLLEDHGFDVDAWETTYRMRLPPGGVLEWLKGTTLRPYIEALGEEAHAWLDMLGKRLDAAYPEDGRGVVFPFTRRFVVALSPR